MIFAIDPGTTHSAIILYYPETGQPSGARILENEEVRKEIEFTKATIVAIEMIQSFGMSVGQSTFQTCVEIGRMIEVAEFNRKHVVQVYRKEEKIHLCGSMRAKDGNIRQAIIDRYPPSGGGKTPQIGTKKAPGPLYGISSHMWMALAVAITAAETHNLEAI